MAKMPSNSTDWKSRLKAELRRDKKKTVALAVLLTVAGVTGGKLVITMSVPRDVKASPTRQEEPDATDAQPAEGPWVSVPRPSAETFANQARREEYLAGMDRDITRDLFNVDISRFPPRPGAGGPDPQTEMSTTGWLGMVYQRVVQKQQQDGQQLAKYRAILAQARSLSLQSTMLGSAPTALINGQVLRQGDYISGFLVKSIASNRCVVSKDGVDIELRMDRPAQD